MPREKPLLHAVVMCDYCHKVHIPWRDKPKRQYVNANRHAVPVVLEKGPDGYTATTPVLKGCIAEGDTIQEALRDFKRALNSLLAAYASEHRAVPWKAEPLRLGEANTRVLTVLI
ncbi:MAG: type II toxin-antitoxin system HicB family antitoxin [Planctomycetota bacterium]|nr:type II toxin-antitoxin system HicB family antitoxin [Planctomycetota bacterium]